MNFIKNLIKKVSENYVEFFKSYLLTNIVIIISTLITIIFVDDEIAGELLKYEIFFFINSFTIENFFKNKTSRIVGYIVAYIISFILGYLFNNYESEFANFFIFYLISIASINLYCIIKELKLELSTYAHKIFSNLVTTSIINIVLTIGVMAVLGILTSLLLTDYDGDLFLRAFIAILGFYTIPAYLYAFINKKADTTELANVLLKYVIIPLTYIALLIVYLYIMKIAITRNMPSNSVFGIILALFIESIPVFILIKDLKIKNKLVNFVDNNISYIFIPLYILQAYAIIVRVITYGLTEERYLGITALIVEAMILFLMKFNERKYLIYTLFIFVIASAVTFIVPKINYEDLSISYHVSRIEKIMGNKEFKDLNGENQAKVIGSYNYLDDRDALDKLDTKIDKKIIKEQTKDYDYFDESYEVKDEVDISKYKAMKKINTYSNTFEKNNLIKIDGYYVELDDLLTRMINHEEIKETLIYELDVNHDLYISNINISGYNHKVNYAYIDGYILTK